MLNLCEIKIWMPEQNYVAISNIQKRNLGCLLEFKIKCSVKNQVN